MYYQGKAPAELQRPGVLMAGVVSVFVTVLLTLATAMMLILSYKWVTGATDVSSTSDQQMVDLLRSNLLIAIGFYAVVGLALAVGAIMTLRQMNGGRIIVWIAGGLLSVVNLCCGFTLSIFVAAISEASKTSDIDAPTGELTTATVFNFAAMAGAILAMILIAQGSVGRWIKDAAQSGSFSVPAAGAAAYQQQPYPQQYPQQQGYQAPQQPYQAPPPQQPPGGSQYGPGSYGDQYGPGQYNGGDQYGPGQSSGPPSGW